VETLTAPDQLGLTQETIPIKPFIVCAPWAFGEGSVMGKAIQIVKEHGLLGVRDNWPGYGLHPYHHWAWYDGEQKIELRKALRSAGLRTIVTLFNANHGVELHHGHELGEDAMGRQAMVAALANSGSTVAVKALYSLAEEATIGLSGEESGPGPDIIEAVNPDLYPMLTPSGIGVLESIARDVARARGFRMTPLGVFIYDDRPRSLRLYGIDVGRQYPCEVGVSRIPDTTMMMERICRVAGIAQSVCRAGASSEDLEYGLMAWHEAVPAGYGPQTYPDRCLDLWRWETYRTVRKSLGITDQEDRYALISRNSRALLAAVKLLRLW